MKRIGLWLVLCLGLTAANLWAADGSSGCGPAWYVFKDNSLVSSSLRTITNGFLAPTVTFGMTTGTSNCTKHSIVLIEQQKNHYVAVNNDQLQSDIAQGHGVYVDQFTALFGCGASETAAAVLQRNYRTLYAQPEGPQAVVNRAQLIISRSEELAGQCAA